MDMGCAGVIILHWILRYFFRNLRSYLIRKLDTSWNWSSAAFPDFNAPLCYLLRTPRAKSDTKSVCYTKSYSALVALLSQYERNITYHSSCMYYCTTGTARHCDLHSASTSPPKPTKNPVANCEGPWYSRPSI